VFKYVNKFWKDNIEDENLTGVREIDQVVHNLIHQLLVLGETEPARQYISFHQRTRVTHQEQIDAIKDIIKPGLINNYVRSFKR
jgi:hypothetical protein